MNDRVWLKHSEHGGHFLCPADAVAEWQKLGWEPTDEAPAEFNPTTAEYVAPGRVAEPAVRDASSDETPEQTTASRRGASKSKES